MKKINKRIKNCLNSIDKYKFYNLNESINIIKNFNKLKFIESLDICIILNIKYNFKDKKIIGYSSFPYGNGKKNCIAIISNENDINKLRSYGADIFDIKDLIYTLKNNTKKIDVIILSNNSIDIFKNNFINIIKPVHLIPSVKLGTITNDIKKKVEEIRLGQSFFIIDKFKILNISIGKLNFSNNYLISNIKSLIINISKLINNKNINKAISKIYLSSTMSISLKINKDNFFNEINNKE